MNRFKGKTAIVTGAGSGIGNAIAKALASEGANVMINDKNADSIDQFIDLGNGKGLCGDMSNTVDIKKLVDYTIAHFGSVDLLVANAGITQFAPFLELGEDEFDKVTNLNLKGTFFLTQLVAREMVNHGGKIVLISSNISKRAYPNLSVYSMTKAAINMMARSLSLELAPYQININALAPGATLTERTINEGVDYSKAWSAIIPTGRPAEVEDISNTALFLLSDQARQINGQTILVDGGWTGISVNPNQT
ncbi:SDR family oxidoreductase [Flavobacteriaceae bacterium F89]|uniref:SDR family oxidoreductase n=1 Tax=Cerina litoralis TaxID=2874477 RepID=A0AAE3JRR0_9FLAO|nr:SDR family oxidoreductase [Cerina litoralis]MCG2461638.1 SDR family oxidoreductase [Cerina litoralis]